ncbi:putative extracellular dioxygenase [Thozetella sp. PMI_491]|nr:putative extracellular dioxygenase [Thozetella sp. PMI_491]
MHFPTVARLAIGGLFAVASAHPGGHDHLSSRELHEKREMYLNTKRSLGKCAKRLESSGLEARAMARRRAAVEVQRRSLKAKKRDEETVLNTDHNRTALGFSPCTPEEILFASNGTCILNPVSEFGPFWVKGEYVRKDLREDQPGVPVIIEGQFIDAETCEPIEGIYWDMWNCNATGVYSGVVASNNGNGDDQNNINATFLRGIQQTDAEGVATFNTLFPGHYDGRATHTHTIAHLNATLLPNNTLSGGNVAYVGHLFWDQQLIYDIEALYPYNTNTITITENADDSIFPNEAATIDPVFNYVQLGDSLEDGLFAWVTVAINTTATYTESYSFELTQDGGEASENAGDINSGGAGGTPGNGTMPTGAMPSGAAPSAAATTAA